MITLSGFWKLNTAILFFVLIVIQLRDLKV